MNKLAVLAFSILVGLSALSWYLAKGSLNDYLKSQVTLQGQYYSGQQTSVNFAILNEANGQTTVEQLYLTNLNGYQAPYVLTVDKVHTRMANPADSSEPQTLKDGLRTSQIITLANVSIETLTVFIEAQANQADALNTKLELKLTNNIEQLLQKITKQLASDYPVLYPEVAAKLYAEQHPELNAQLILEASSEESNNIVDAIASAEANNQAVITAKAEKKRKQRLGKAQTRIAIQQLNVEKFIIKTVKQGQTKTIQFNDVNFGALSDANGLASNQVGGEILRLLLSKAQTLEKANR